MVTKKAPAKPKAGTKAKAKIPVVGFRDAYPAAVVLISGPEDFFAGEALQALKRILKTEDPTLEVTELDAASYAPGELATYVSPSLFLEPRLVEVTNVERASDAFLDDALSYLEGPVEGTTLVLRHSSGVRGKKLLDAVRARSGDAVEVECPKPKANELVDLVASEVRSAGRRIMPRAAAMLVASFNTDLAELMSACRQLMTVSDDVITEDVVDRYYGDRVETTGFKIADAAIAGRLADTLGLTRHGFATGVHPVQIVSAVAGKLRLMAKVAGRPGSDAALAKEAEAAPWQVGQAKRDLRGWTDETLGQAIELTAETDHAVKGLSRDAEFAVERMLRLIATRDFG